MKTLLIIVSCFLLGMSTFAADTKKMSKGSFDITKEQREKMAETHEKMAACLRSDKAFETCRHEMMQACKQNMGEDACPMMGKGMMHMRNMHE